MPFPTLDIGEEYWLVFITATDAQAHTVLTLLPHSMLPLAVALAHLPSPPPARIPAVSPDGTALPAALDVAYVPGSGK